MRFEVFDLGLTDFKIACEFQKKIFADVKTNLLKSALILCRHQPVITLGRGAKKENIKASENELGKKGIGIYALERGGDVTYHGPGQLIAYPVFNLNHLKKDIHLFLRQLEEVIIGLLFEFGIKALRRANLTGVWVNDKKIASIGIAIKNWITFHGLSLNIKNDDLENFQLINPCGMDIKMTSLESAAGRDIEIDAVKEKLIHKFRDTFLLKAPTLPGTLR